MAFGPSAGSKCFNITVYLSNIEAGACAWNGNQGKCKSGDPCEFIFQVKVESKTWPANEGCCLTSVVGIGLIDGWFATQTYFGDGLVYHDTRELRCNHDYVFVVKERSAEIVQIAFVCSGCMATTLPPH